MKRFTAIFLSVVIIVLSVFSVSAEANYKGLNEFNKSSLSDFVGRGGLSKSTKRLITFDSTDVLKNGFSVSPLGSFDKSNKKQGTSSLKFTASGGTYNSTISNISYQSYTVFSGTPGFNVDVTDVMSQTVGMWFYVDDIDNLPCDHDTVYNTFQENCGTIYFRFGTSSSNYHQWNHTFAGSGWHYIEFALGSKENTSMNWRQNIIYNDMKYMALIVKTMGKKVTINIDEISLITYKTTASTPKAPYNGRWISTFDYNLPDGPTVTEWLGTYYDTSNKTQGASSLMIRGRKEHVDYREVLCGYDDMPFYLDEEVLCVDLYIEDVSLIGTKLDFNFYDITENYTLYINYSLINQYAENGKLKNGWNSLQIPLSSMKRKGTMSNGIFYLSRIKIFWEGASTSKYYTIGYDNMYLAKKSEIEKGETSNSSPSSATVTSSKPTSKPKTSNAVISSDPTSPEKSENISSLSSSDTVTSSISDSDSSPEPSDSYNKASTKLPAYAYWILMVCLAVIGASVAVIIISVRKKPNK